MPKLSRYTVAIALLLACLLLPLPALAGKDYSADRFDVDLTVQPDGSLLVRETVVFRFAGGPFTYAFRDLAYTEIDEIDRLQAGMDGITLSQGTGPGQVEIVAARPLKVTWHFAPTSDSTHEFTLTYRVQGAIRKETSADALIWRAIPEDHDYDIERSTITLRYPDPSMLVGAPELSGAAAGQASGDGQFQWIVTGIDADESVVVTARFSPGSLVEAPPQWQSNQNDRRQQTSKALPVGLGAGFLTLVAGLVALSAFLMRQRRTGGAGRAQFLRVSAPPDQTPPGLAVRLAKGGMPSLATLFDLANRGLVRIEESGKGLLGGKRYSLVRLPSGEELRPHEEGLLRALFQEKDGQQLDSLPFSQVPGRLSSRAKWYREPLEQEMQDAGWIDPRRKAAGKRLVVAAVIAILASLVAIVVGCIVAGLATAKGPAAVLILGAMAAGLGVALFLLGLVALSVGGTFSPLSEQGEMAAASWKSFGIYLKDIARGREFVSGEAQFERYLPFAAGLQLGESWAKRYQKEGYAVIPAWFRSLEADGGDFGGIVGVMASTNAFFSSGDGGAGGAAGASGGGASGAG